MARSLSIIWHEEADQLEALYKSEKEPQRRTRLHALWLVRLGLKKVGAIAQQIKLINSFARSAESNFDLRHYWEHSVGCALIADKLYTRKLLPLKAKVEFSDY